MIRAATNTDTAAIVALCVEALSIDPYTELRIDREKIFHGVQECVCSATHFSWVAEKDGEIVGALGAMVYPFLMYERKQAMVMIWYSKSPGDGIRLMRKFVSWVNEKPMIKQVVYGGERNADRRVGKLFERTFKGKGKIEILPTYVMTR